MLKIISGFVFILFLFSCSSMSKNIVQHGNYTLNGGVAQNKTWTKGLTFKRVSWYHELFLAFDLNIINKKDLGEFKNWLSPDEREMVEGCHDFNITLSYSGDSKKISHTMFINSMRELGFQSVSVPTFYANLKMHPDFTKNSLTLYRVHGFCSKTENSDELKISFPGFNVEKI